MASQHLTPDRYAAQPWRNGLGTSRTIASATDPAGRLCWTLSLTAITQDCPFSDYRGYDRVAERADDGASFTAIHARRTPPEGAVMIISRSHAAKELVKAEEMGERIQGTLVAGSSLKFCRLAEGAADLYPRFGPTMEWDTAAGQAVLEAAGGSVHTTDGAPLRYGKPGFRNPHFIARGAGHG